MNDVTIRRATKKDGASLLRLIDALAEYEKLKGPGPAARRRLLNDAFGKTRRFHVFLAFHDGVAVGYALYFFAYSSFLSLPSFYLEDLFVLPDCRKKKVGIGLFRACVAEAKRSGCGHMDWVVLDWNTNAIRFYKRLHARYMKEWLLYRITL